MTMPVLPFLISPGVFQGEPIAPGVGSGSNETFGSVLSSALQLPVNAAVTVPAPLPNAGLSATSLASVPIILGAVSLGTMSGDAVAFVSETLGLPRQLPAETTEPEQINGEQVMRERETPEAPAPIAVDGSAAAVFVPVAPGLTVAPSGSNPSSATATTHAPRSELQPVFADRLHRVIERMETEFGYRVEVVETVRTQSRQDALYAQGRERAGPIVTWTRNSRHIDGLAADVMIDGSYGNAPTYRQLAQLAREEGLRTLGPRDPGHIEFPRSSHLTTSEPETSAMPVPAGRGSAGAREPVRAARLRNVVASYRSETGKFQAPQRPAPVEPTAIVPTGVDAPVLPAPARVDPVAMVATVATVAMPDARVTQTPNAQRATTERNIGRRAPEKLQPTVAVAESGPRSTALVDESTHIPIEPTLASGEAERDRQSVPDRLDFIETTDFGMQLVGNLETAAQPVTEATRSTSERSVSPILSERIAELLNLRDAAAERPLSSVLLRLDAPDGTEDRIRIGLRGSSIDAAFEMNDRALVEDLNRHVGELARAVERQGFEPDHLVARSSVTKDPVLAQAMAGEREGLRVANAGSANSSTPGNREGRTPRQDASPEHPPRQRARRDPHGDR